MVTISSLRMALSQPESHFRTIEGLLWKECEIMRTTYFAQTRVTISGKRFILSIPLAPTSLRRIERFIPLQRHIASAIVPRLEILRNEMKYQLNEQTHYCDILLEHLPDALPFTDALADIGDSQEAEQYIISLHNLEQQLIAADVSHNNLRAENLLIDAQSVLYPICWYYATKEAGGDRDAIASLRNRLCASKSNMELHEPDPEPYTTPNALDGYIFSSQMHEGLIAVESEEGWGFVNCSCEEIIKPQYLWANDFCEGRAEVETERGMGLIDREGNYIIDPIYESVEFDVENGWSRVCKDNQWALFNYSGEQLSEWSDSCPTTNRINE